MRYIALVCLGLAGCAASDQPASYSRAGGSQEILDQEAAGCRNQARAVAGVNQYVYAANVFDDCMTARGGGLISVDHAVSHSSIHRMVRSFAAGVRSS